MKLINNLAEKTIIFAIPTFVLPIILTTSCSVVKKDEKPITNDDPLLNVTSDDIFPQIYIDDYYDLVEFDENAFPQISDKFIMKVIKDVVNRISTNKGTTNFSVTTYSKNSIDINFEWKYLNLTLYKTYSIEIK